MTIPARLAAEIATIGDTRRRLTEALVAHGFSQNDEAARAAVKRIQALRQTRRDRRPPTDPLVSAGWNRRYRLEAIREDRERRAAIDVILASPMAAYWRQDRRAEVMGSFLPDLARDRAIAATLEAVTRIATTKWGFSRRHTSQNRSGAASSRYLMLGAIGEVRISDHYIPVHGEREWRYAENGGPRWGEIVVTKETLNWSVTRWRRELILRAAGRR